MLSLAGCTHVPLVGGWLGGDKGGTAPVPPPPAPVQPYQATGHEPEWRIDLGEQGVMRLALQPPLSWVQPPPEWAGTARRWQAEVNGKPLELTATPGLCRDSMSGMPRPDGVSVRWGDARWRGCGGEAASLLLGPEWLVVSLQGQPLIDRSRATLRFTPEGRFTGLASCNHFTGAWRLGSENLLLNPPAVTMMACAPTVMAQEDRLLALLKAVNRFDFSPKGELLLLTADGRQLAARRN
ncbi:META domain-containing protein [Ideonella azotifigens]|uniref:DUF306 domain-containing protein n=2 Tax=Ideonella azotifigens TaxID=513160 RepID=A0ABN1KG82_9BURK|nr:META domain-containing protein [Ideonella azotifigens]MCD2340445.1 META domain-containing protein [Ideonella azotifigens]